MKKYLWQSYELSDPFWTIQAQYLIMFTMVSYCLILSYRHITLYFRVIDVKSDELPSNSIYCLDLLVTRSFSTAISRKWACSNRRVMLFHSVAMVRDPSPFYKVSRKQLQIPDRALCSVLYCERHANVSTCYREHAPAKEWVFTLLKKDKTDRIGSNFRCGNRHEMHIWLQ